MKNADEEFVELVRAHYESVYRFLFRFVRTREEAENLTQETFIKAWRHLKKFDPTKNFKTWVFTIAKNTALDFLKKKSESNSVSLSVDEILDSAEQVPDNAPLPPEIFARSETAKLVETELNKLGVSDRTVLILYYFEGLTFQEISEVLEEPLNTVKSRQRRALAKVRASIIKGMHQN